MIKNVRKKFIKIAMLAITVCTLLLIAAINSLNFYQVDREITQIMETLKEYGGSFPGKDRADIQENTNILPPEETNLQKEDFPKNFGKEAAYETRYFSVKIYDNGSTDAELIHIATVDEDGAVALADEVMEEGKTSGYLGNYKYMLISTDTYDQILFMDCESRISAMASLLGTSIVIATLGIFIMFVFITLMSKKAIRPVVESMEKQKQFITDASHELKTPITVISTNMDILTMDLGKNEWVEATKRQVTNLKTLVTSLVTLSRLEEENLEIIMGHFNVSRAVEETAEPFVSMAEFEGKSMNLQLEEGLEIVGDENAIRQLMGILCDNAVKYATDGGDILVQLKKRGKRIEIKVINSYERQLEEETLNKLFDRFYRADESRTKEQGKNSYGIGLALAKAIVEKNNGKLTVAQTLEHRIVFTLVL